VLEAAQTAQCAEFIIGRRFAPTRWLIAPYALLEGGWFTRRNVSTIERIQLTRDQVSMKRFLIFTALFPPLVLVVYIVADQFWREGFPEFGFLGWLVGIAYVLAIVPAWLTAGVDAALSRQPIYLRVIATMAVAAILAELVARYMGQPHFDVPVAIAGAIPAAVCSWLAGMKPA
jgi:hypothetical protein